ncbi:MAG: sugar transferase, partial [Oscillospiraceae bacterium]
DERVTKIGRVLRKYRLDELLQLFNILKGDMSFVGSRPEVPQYVDYYTKNMLATLLLPVGLTSRASIEFKDENKLLSPLNYKETYLNIFYQRKCN